MDVDEVLRVMNDNLARLVIANTAIAEELAAIRSCLEKSSVVEDPCQTVLDNYGSTESVEPSFLGLD